MQRDLQKQGSMLHVSSSRELQIEIGQRKKALHKPCLVYRVIPCPLCRILEGHHHFPNSYRSCQRDQRPPQQGGGRPSSNQQQGAQDQTTSGMIPIPGHRPWNHNNSATGSRQPPRLPGSSIISNPNNGGVSSFPQQIQQLPEIIPLPTQQGAEGLSSSHHQGNQRQTTPGFDAITWTQAVEPQYITATFPNSGQVYRVIASPPTQVTKEPHRFRGRYRSYRRVYQRHHSKA
ncbi:hypothetical protein MTO96_043842 [Rhipicephalus appendiculatus]